MLFAVGSVLRAFTVLAAGFAKRRCAMPALPIAARRMAAKQKPGNGPENTPSRRRAYRRPFFCTASESYADSTGLGFGLRPHHKCLREWIWGSDGENDHSLYDRDGLTVARVALDGGRYHLRSPIAQPRQLWPDLEQAKRGAESIALACSPLDASTASRSKRDNEKPHPMGPPLGYREAA